MDLSEQQELRFEGKAFFAKTIGFISLKSSSTQDILNYQFDFKYDFEGQLRQVLASGLISDNIITFDAIHEKGTLNSQIELHTPFEQFSGFTIATQAASVQDYSGYTLYVDTTYSDFENLQLKFQFDSTSTHITAEFGDKKLEFMGACRLSYPHYELSTTIITPFTDFKEISLSSVINLSTELSVFIPSDWNHKKLLHVSVDVEGSSMNVELRTPFNHINLKGTLDYTEMGTGSLQYNLAGTGTWGTKQTTLTGKLTHKINGIKFTLAVIPDTPGYDKATINCDISRSADGFNASLSFSVEDTGTAKKFSASIPHYILLEGTYHNTEDGFQTRVKATKNNEEVVNASLAVDTIPGFVHFSAGPRQDNQMVEVRVGLEDILRAEFYVQPQIFTHVMGHLY